MTDTNYQPVIGLEVHVEPKTKSKMFCGCLADYFGAKPNTHVCPVCLGLPGALPVPNKKAIEWCVMIGLALNCKIPLFSRFDRKNYFYPDLPKGYQISQYGQPFCVNGWIDLKSQITNKSKNQISKHIRIRRVHMEEDTAKLIHQSRTQNSKLQTQNLDKEYSLIDFNRSGVPLVEIVTEPDFESASQVVEYLKKIQQIVRYLGVSDADMEKGEMRLEPNISLKSSKLKAQSSKLPDYKVEVKNINSFRFVEKAINYEIERQRKILEAGKIPVQETRGWDNEKEITISQRTKEEAMDYRYFPEADIPPIRWAESQISNLKSQMPELPNQKYLRFQKEYGLSGYDSEILTRERFTADYFEEAVKVNNELRIKNHEYTDPKTIANWIINKKIEPTSILPLDLVKLVIKQRQKTTIDEEELKKFTLEILKKNPKAISDYKKGKTQVIGFLIGKVKKRFPKGDINQIKDVLGKYLKT